MYHGFDIPQPISNFGTSRWFMPPSFPTFGLSGTFGIGKRHKQHRSPTIPIIIAPVKAKDLVVGTNHINDATILISTPHKV